ADVGRGRDEIRTEVALQRQRVLVDLLRNRVLVRVGARLIRAVVRIVDEVGADHARIDGIGSPKCAGGQRRADALGLDRLDLILGLARPDEDAETTAQHRLLLYVVGGGDARLPVALQ